MNMIKILRLALVLIGLAVAGNAVLFLIGKSPFNQEKFNQKRTVTAKSISKLSVSSAVGDVKITPHNKNDIEIHMTGKTAKMNTDDYSFSVMENGETLSIKALQKKRKVLVLFPNDYDLVIKLPIKDFKRLQVNTDAANINLADISADTFHLTTDLGDITARNVKGNIHAKSDVGDLNLYVDHILKDITAKSNLGNISVLTKHAPKNLQTHLKNNLGDETLDLPNEKNGMIGEGGPLVSLTSDVGDLSLSLQK